MIKARKGWCVLKWQAPETYYSATFGLLLPSEQIKRDAIRKQPKHELIAGEYLPDVIRVGTFVSGDIDGAPEDLKPGMSLLFNKHDAFEFKLEGKTYYSIASNLLQAVLYPQAESTSA